MYNLHTMISYTTHTLFYILIRLAMISYTTHTLFYILIRLARLQLPL